MTATAELDRRGRAVESSATLSVLLLALTALTAVRYVGLATSQIELVFDEAQYWTWSLDPAFGYFSKPPGIAWLIWVQNTVCGTDQFCARSSVPLIHMGTSLVIYLIGRRLFDSQVGFWSALMFALLPGISFSSRLITTDVPLLFCWAVALYALLRIRDGGGYGWATLLGTAIGFGLLSKYAMIYFGLCLVVWAILDREGRAVLRSGPIAVAGIIAAALIAPNVWWNIDNGFITFLHTQDNANWGLANISPTEAWEFFSSQLGVFGPITFAVFLAAIWQARGLMAEREDGHAWRFLIAFSVPVVALIVFQALMSRAHANWAAPAYVAATILVTALMLRKGWLRLFAATFMLHIAVQATLLFADARAETLRVPFMETTPYQRALGGKALAAKTMALYDAGSYTGIVTDWRRTSAVLLYNLRDNPPTIIAWPHPERPHDHYQLTRPITSQHQGPFLLIARCSSQDRVEAAFESVTRLEEFSVPAGPGAEKHYMAFAVDKPRLNDFPRPGC